METKICVTCKEEKLLNCFNFTDKRKIHYRSECKVCGSTSCKKYQKNNQDKIKSRKEKNKERDKKNRAINYLNNSEKYKLYSKKYRETNPEKIKENNKLYKENNKERNNITYKAWRDKNDIKIKQKSKIFREANRESINESARKSYKKHSKAYIERSRKYQKENIEKIREYDRKRAKCKSATDPIYKLKKSLRGRTLDAFTCIGKKKNTKSEKLLGVSFKLAKLHLERQFTKGMNWENHGNGAGKWNIDHKIPIASAKTESDIKTLCHYTNLSPMWSKDNILKRDKILPIQISLII